MYYHRKPLGPTMCVYWPVGCTKLKWIKTFDQGFNVIETNREACTSTLEKETKM